MCTINERELLLGFPRDHTLAAVKSGVAKSNPGYELACRLSLCGNSWAVPGTAFLIGSVLAEWGFLRRAPTVEEVVHRNTSHLLTTVAADPRHVTEGPRRRQVPDDERLVRRLAAGCEHTGSDVRMSTGALVKPNVYPAKRSPSVTGNGRQQCLSDGGEQAWTTSTAWSSSPPSLQSSVWREPSASMGAEFCTFSTAARRSQCSRGVDQPHENFIRYVAR